VEAIIVQPGLLEARSNREVDFQDPCPAVPQIAVFRVVDEVRDGELSQLVDRRGDDLVGEGVELAKFKEILETRRDE
jgi:hypothetical protein